MAKRVKVKLDRDSVRIGDLVMYEIEGHKRPWREGRIVELNEESAWVDVVCGNPDRIRVSRDALYTEQRVTKGGE